MSRDWRIRRFFSLLPPVCIGIFVCFNSSNERMKDVREMPMFIPYLYLEPID